MRIVKRRLNSTSGGRSMREAYSQMRNNDRESLLWDIVHSIDGEIPYYENMRDSIDEVILGDKKDLSGTLVDVYSLAEQSADDEDEEFDVKNAISIVLDTLEFIDGTLMSMKKHRKVIDDLKKDLIKTEKQYGDVI